MSDNMRHDRRDSVENEFRSSQVYRKISESGGNVADKLAEGLGKASRAVDGALDSVEHALHTGRRYSNQRHPYAEQRPPRNPGNRYDDNQNRGAGAAPHKAQAPRPPEPYRYVPNARREPEAPRPVYPQNQPQAAPNARWVQPPEQPAPNVIHPANVQVKMVRQPSAKKYWATGITAVILAIVMPLYNFWQLAVFMGILTATFFASSKIFKGKKKYVAVPIEEPSQAEPEKTGNEDVDTAIAEGYDYLRRLRKANDAIADEKMSECISRIEQASAGIFAYISSHPEKVSQIRKFMNYYLPTTMKLLDSYQRLDAQAVKGENIQSTLSDIDRILYTVAGAFEKQLDSLFSEEAMDISTDISVFETMLQQEGFVSDNEIPEAKTTEK